MAVWVSVGEHWGGEGGAWVGLAGRRNALTTEYANGVRNLRDGHSVSARVAAFLIHRHRSSGVQSMGALAMAFSAVVVAVAVSVAEPVAFTAAIPMPSPPPSPFSTATLSAIITPPERHGLAAFAVKFPQFSIT